MSSPHQQGPLTGGYDQSLLAAAPAASRAAKQEGYNVDLLDEGRHRSTPPTRTQESAENSHPKEHHYAPAAAGAPVRKVPFWRTRRGIIILAVLAVIVVGAVVGGAVGGSVGKKSGGNGQGFLPSPSQQPVQPGGSGSTDSSMSASSTPPPGQQQSPQSSQAEDPNVQKSLTGNLVVPTLLPPPPQSASRK